jgi:O-6-methylguanine DNA methyltransferase
MKTCELTKVEISSPVGPWIWQSCPQGLHSVKLSENVTNQNFLSEGCEKIESNSQLHQQNFQKWMIMYFQGNINKEIDEELEICPNVFLKKGFRAKVWLILKNEVKFGDKISYGQLAKLSGSPGASQAVGSAMSNNPISLVIPCHRVIKANGTIGNYSKATKNDVKLWLLNHEASFVQNQ